MAVAAPQGGCDGGNSYVQVYYLDGNIWKKLGQRIEEMEHSTTTKVGPRLAWDRRL